MWMFHFVFLTISPITWNLFWPSSTAAPIDGGVNSSCLCIRYKKRGVYKYNIQNIQPMCTGSSSK